jgi:hypothetical protein
MDSLKCQTPAATPAEPGDLPLLLGQQAGSISHAADIAASAFETGQQLQCSDTLRSERQ